MIGLSRRAWQSLIPCSIPSSGAHSCQIPTRDNKDLRPEPKRQIEAVIVNLVFAQLSGIEWLYIRKGKAWYEQRSAYRHSKVETGTFPDVLTKMEYFKLVEFDPGVKGSRPSLMRPGKWLQTHIDLQKCSLGMWS